MTEFNALRPITQRLTSTPVKELPHIAYFLASSISNCGQALQTASGQATSRSNDTVVLVHKLKTRISSLLQDRSCEGRFIAVVLVKAIVEAGGREVLGSSESWVRGLLAVLGKSDSASTKKLCLIAITRIFSLTQQYPTLVREITTPLLPTFITACLTLIKPNVVRTDDGTKTILSPFLETIFRSLSELLPHHPTIFRPFAARLNTIALSLIGDASTPLAITDVASNIITALHFSASKNAAGAEWAQTCKSVVLSCHLAADQVFRSVIEDWESSEQIESSASVNRNYHSKVQASGPDVFGLPGWIGVHDGTQRLVILLRLLLKLLSRQTAQTVSCPVGTILNLTSRLTAVTALADARASQFSARLNTEVGRDERDELWIELPNVHIATLDLLSIMLESFAETALPIARIVFDQTMNVFEAEERNEGLRTAAYRLTEQLLCLVGFSLIRPDVDVLTIVVKRCCADLISQAGADPIPINATSTKIYGSKPNGSTQVDADSFVNHQRESPQSHSSCEQEPVYRAAFRLLPCFLSNLPASTVPHSLRTEIDRTAILIQNRRALLASVLSPPLANRGQHAPPSIMPFLARASSGDLDIEGFLRPRMPLIRNDQLYSNGYEDMSEEEDSVDSQAAGHAEEVDDNSNADLPEEPDLLDRLEHSLDNSPVDTKHDANGLAMKRTAVDANESSAYQSLSKPTTKRNLVAMNDQGVSNDKRTGVQDVIESHPAAGSSITYINKRRRLEDDPRMLDSGNGTTMTPVETSGLHELEIQVATMNSSLEVSTQEQPKQGTDNLSNTLKQDTTRVQDNDDGSDFEIPEIIDSSSEDDEG
jgi:pre-rRNA-processing protein RIX1